MGRTLDRRQPFAFKGCLDQELYVKSIPTAVSLEAFDDVEVRGDGSLVRIRVGAAVARDVDRKNPDDAGRVWRHELFPRLLLSGLEIEAGDNGRNFVVALHVEESAIRAPLDQSVFAVERGSGDLPRASLAKRHDLQSPLLGEVDEPLAVGGDRDAGPSQDPLRSDASGLSPFFSDDEEIVR